MKFPIRLYKVSGHSMQPYFMENDIVIISSMFPIRIFDVVVFRIGDKVMIKRVIEIKNTAVRVAGDNISDSLDSRTFGDVQKRDIIGKVILRI